MDLGCKIKANCPHVGPGPMDGGGVFLRDPSLNLCEFQRKPWNTLNGWVDKLEPELNSVPPVYYL